MKPYQEIIRTSVSAMISDCNLHDRYNSQLPELIKLYNTIGSMLMSEAMGETGTELDIENWYTGLTILEAMRLADKYDLKFKNGCPAWWMHDPEDRKRVYEGEHNFHQNKIIKK